MTGPLERSLRNPNLYRSRAERLIAGLLDQYGLPFIYEKPTAVTDHGQVRIWYPDFTLSYGLLIEYFGIHGDSDYNRRTQHKLNVYRENQFDVLPLYPSDLSCGWQSHLLSRIDGVLETRVADYRASISVHRGYGAARQHPHDHYPSSTRG